MGQDVARQDAAELAPVVRADLDAEVRGVVGILDREGQRAAGGLEMSGQRVLLAVLVPPGVRAVRAGIEAAG